MVVTLGAEPTGPAVVSHGGTFCGGDTVVGSLYMSGSSYLALRVLPATALERSHALRYGQVTHVHWICILAGSHRV